MSVAFATLHGFEWLTCAEPLRFARRNRNLRYKSCKNQRMCTKTEHRGMNAQLELTGSDAIGFATDGGGRAFSEV